MPPRDGDTHTTQTRRQEWGKPRGRIEGESDG
jgi:hypothetical protein